MVMSTDLATIRKPLVVMSIVKFYLCQVNILAEGEMGGEQNEERRG